MEQMFASRGATLEISQTRGVWRAVRNDVCPEGTTESTRPFRTEYLCIKSRHFASGYIPLVPSARAKHLGPSNAVPSAFVR
jgi:hypothetical protein